MELSKSQQKSNDDDHGDDEVSVTIKFMLTLGILKFGLNLF